MERVTLAHNTAAIRAIDNGFDGSFYEKFFQYLQVKPTTFRAYSVAIRNFRDYLNANAIRSPERLDVQNWVEHLTNSERKEPTTVRLYVAAVKVFFSFLANDLQCYPNAAARVKAPKQPRGHRKGALDVADCSRILATINTRTIKGKRDRAIILLMLCCGLRDVEIRRANIDNLTTAAGSNVLEVHGKGRDAADEIVVLPAPVVDALREYISVRPAIPADDNLGPDGQPGGKRGEPLFVSLSTNDTNGRITTQSVSRVCKLAMRSAGIDDKRFTAHSLRHTFATLAYRGGMTIEELRQACRHANISTTTIYVHEADAAKNKCSATVSAALFG